MARDDEIASEVVGIRPDLKGFDKLQAQVTSATRGVKAKIPLVADASGLRADIRAKLAGVKTPTLKVRLVADQTGFVASARAELRNAAKRPGQPVYRVKLVADARGFNKSAREALKNAGAVAGGGGGTGSGGGGAGGGDGDEAKRHPRASFFTASIKGDLNQVYRRIRNLDEQTELDIKAAKNEDFLRPINEMVRRFDLTRKGIRETEKQAALARQAAEDAEDDYFLSLQRRFDLQRKGAQATAKNTEAEEKANRARALSDIKHAEFVHKVNEELARVQRDRADDEITIAHQAEDAKTRIERAGSKLRIALLEAEAKAEDQQRRENERAERDSLRRRAAQAKASRDARKGPPVIDYGGRGIRPGNLLRAGLVLTIPVLTEFASSAALAASSVAALGAASIGAGAAVTGLAIGFSGVLGALKLRETVKDQNLVKAATNELADAQDRLREAQRDELLAQRAIGDARKDAIRDLADLRQAVRNLQEQEGSDRLSVSEARDREAATRRNFFASALDRARALQDVRDAETRLADTQLERRQKTADLADSLKRGIEGSDRVVQARERARDARRATVEAQRSVKVGGGTESSAAAQLRQQLKDMAPAAREMYYFFERNETLFKRLSRGIQQEVLPGFNVFLEQITAVGKDGKSSLSIFAEAAGRLGGRIGNIAAAAGKETRESYFRKDFATIIDANAEAIDTFGKAGVRLIKPLMTIFRAASPLLTRFADGFADFAVWFDKVIGEADRSGALAEFFNKAGTEMGRWINLGKEVLRLLGGIFTASQPGGSVLMDRLITFVSSAADWANGEGQAKMRAFFDRLATLPYAQIGRTIADMISLFAAIRVVRFLGGGPLNALYGALTAIAAANPAGAATALGWIASAVTAIGKAAAANPEVTTLILGMLALTKAKKALGINIAIPVVSDLVSRFKPLEKLFGSGTTTGTMTVHAGVVNILGGSGAKPGTPGTPGTPGKPGTPGAKPGRSGGAIGSIGAAIGLGLGAWFVSEVPESGMNNFQTAVKDAFASTLTGASMGAAFGGPWGAAAGAAIGAVVGGVANREGLFGKTVLTERQAFEATRGDIARNKGTGLSDEQKRNILSRRYLQQYIDARKKSLRVAVENARATGTEADAVKVYNQEIAASRYTLGSLLQDYGIAGAAADKLIYKVFGFGEAVDGSKISFDGLNNAIVTAGVKIPTAAAAADRAVPKFNAMGNSIKATDKQAETLITRTGQVDAALTAVVGTRTILLKADGYETVLKQLENLYKYQFVLYNPQYSNSAAGADTVSSQNQYIDPITGKPKKYMATGGPVIGAGTATSDSNLAWLSHGEYVQPAASVQHYGAGFMEAVRTKQFPKFADGGMFGRAPFNVNVEDLPMPAITLPAGAGQAVGDQAVAAIAEATARAMGASDKQLLALIEAGIVESGLRNINYGDRDSVGFLQQRASWGSTRDRMNVARATQKFISKARRVDKAGYTAGQLAQAVQVSAFPLRYDQREADALAVLNALPPYVFGGSRLGAGQTPGTWQGLWSIIKGRFPTASLFSAFRRGSRTLSGNVSRHSLGKAIDTNPWRSLAQFIHSNYGASTYELISPYRELDLKRGRPFRYSDAVHRQHSGSNAHVHWASYDTGGTLPPGFTLAYNGTGRNETIRTHEQEKALTAPGPARIDRRDLLALAQVIAASQPSVNLDGRKVAEMTNRYNYLPAGV